MRNSLLFIFTMFCSLAFVKGQDDIMIFVQGNQLYNLSQDDCSLELINQFSQSFTDIALHSNGNLYGIRSNGQIFELIEEDGSTTFVHEISRNANTIFTALGSSVNGNLYIGELDGDIDTYNPDTDIENYVGNIGFNIEGDLSFRDGELLAGSTNGIVIVDQEFTANSALIPWFTSEPIWGINTDYVDCNTQYSFGITGINSPSTIYRLEYETETFTEICQINQLVYGSTSEDELFASSTIDIDFMITQPICGVDPQVEIVINEGFALEFSINGGEFSTQLIYDDLMLGVNEVDILDGNGCEAEDSFFIENPTPAIDVIVQEINATCEQAGRIDITVNSGDGLRFIIDGETFTDTSIEILEFGSNRLIVRDEYNCEEEIEFTIEDDCQATDEDNIITVPNVFAPNTNSLNETFRVLSVDEVQVDILAYQIFDRWGNLVFENSNFSNHNLEENWNGLRENGDLFEGIFLYYITYEVNGIRDEVINGELSGTAYVIR